MLSANPAPRRAPMTKQKRSLVSLLVPCALAASIGSWYFYNWIECLLFYCSSHHHKRRQPYRSNGIIHYSDSHIFGVMAPVLRLFSSQTRTRERQYILTLTRRGVVGRGNASRILGQASLRLSQECKKIPTALKKSIETTFKNSQL